MSTQGLTPEQVCVLLLLRHALSGLSFTREEGLDATAMVDYIRRGGILPTVYLSLSAFPELRQLLQSEYYASISQIVNQVHEGKHVISALSDGQMRCVPMKGWEIRKYYPNTIMRQMTDLDVLVRPYDYSCVRDVMANLGFVPADDESADKHDVYRKGAITVEVHKRIRDDVAAVRAWEDYLWDRAQESPDGTWCMTNEDVYIAHFEHMCHDFRNGWFGLRRMVDAWLLDQHWGEMDADYITMQLEAMGLKRFCDRMCRLGRQMMGEEPLDANAVQLLRYAFDCGIYGNGKSYKVGRIVSLTGGKGGLVGGKARSLVAHCFLPYGRMKAQYPVLEKWPMFLPVCWVHRIAYYLRDGHLATYHQMMDYSDISEEDLEEMRNLFDLAGC